MVLIFDLDDTLYDEMSFVTSGLHAVASFGESLFGWEEGESFEFMHATLQKNGRGKVFDEWLRAKDRHTRTLVARCVNVYRHHNPNIALFPIAKQVLELYERKCHLYLVTDGHKDVQENKVNALQIATLFKRIFITHRFGIRHAKPSLHCFEIIRRAERCEWIDMVYVGDNPAKDFVNLNAVGAQTVRVSTGSHSSVVAHPHYDARITIPDLSYLQNVLDQ
jgi:putative hydrolase of the HAD superfamily